MKRSTPKKTNYNFKALFDTLATAEAADVSTYHGPRGNSKLGEIPAFNLLPGCSCSPEARAHCMIEGCYAVKNVFSHGYNVNANTVLKAWTDNTVLAKRHVYTLETQIESYLNQNRPQFFRIHSAGDFISVKYARMWYRIAKRHSETRFLAFTKQWDIIRHVFFYRIPNFELVLSGWIGISIPEDLRRHYRCAWCDDGIEDRIPANAIECPGSCDACGMCWHLSELGRDTKFHKH